MPRAVSNRHSRGPGPYERSSARPDPGSGSSGGEKVERRESGLRALSRRISQVFARSSAPAADESSDERAQAPHQDGRVAEVVANSQFSRDTSFDSQHSVASRAPTASRKASVNLSLLRSQRDLRLPAHMIVEAYREALCEKAEASMQKRVASSPSTPSEAPPRKILRVERTSVASVSSPNHSAVRKPKPIRHKIQLVTKPVLDLSMLPEDRKKRPGFISANFDVSDDDIDVDPEPAKQQDPVAALVRRPQVASDKLQRAFAEAKKPDPGKNSSLREESSFAPPTFDSSAAKLPVLNGQGASAEKRKAPSQNNPDAPKFNFGSLEEGAASAPSDLPKFSFGASRSSAEASAPKFSFDTTQSQTKGENITASKSFFGSHDAKNKPAENPTFDFSSSTNNKLSGDDSSGTKSGTPAFTLGSSLSASTNGNKPAANPSFSFKGSQDKAEETAPFVFGTQNGQSAKTDNKAEPSAVTFNFSATPSEKPKFNFGANGSSSTNTNQGKSSEPSESSNSKAAVTNTPSAPTFSFGGAPDSKKAAAADAVTPAFNFGAKNGAELPAEKTAFGSGSQGASGVTNNGNPASSFSFSGATSGDKPSFSFNPVDGNAGKTPTFGTSGKGNQSGHMPTVSFGTSGSAEAEKPTGSAFNFSASTSKPNEKPTFAFGSGSSGPLPDKPTFAFGTSNDNSAQPEAKSVSALPAPSGSGNSTPSFGFGRAQNAPPTGQGQPFAFGSSKPGSPAPFGANNAGAGSSTFNFGAVQPPASNPKTVTPSSSQATFAFGGAKSSAFGAPQAQGQPPRAFGAPATEVQQQPFLFGSGAGGPTTANDSKASTPFAFGAAAPTNGETTPSFAFGQPQGAPAPGASQFGSRETTPGAGATQQRKIAQVKRRLRK